MVKTTHVDIQYLADLFEIMHDLDNSLGGYVKSLLKAKGLYDACNKDCFILEQTALELGNDEWLLKMVNLRDQVEDTFDKYQDSIVEHLPEKLKFGLVEGMRPCFISEAFREALEND